MKLWVLAVVVAVASGAQAPQERARQLIAEGKSAEAAVIYRELLKSDPRNPMLLVNLAVALFKSEQYEAVIPVCRKALDVDQKLVPAWLFLGASEFQLGRKAEAVNALKRTIELQPSERNARLMLAESLLATGRPDEAAKHFEVATVQMPENPRTWYGLERSYSAVADAAAAEVDSGGRNSAEWHVLAGDKALRRGRPAIAFRHYKEALRKNRRLAGLQESLASLYRSAGHPEWAAIAEQRAAESDPAAVASSYWKVRTGRRLADAALNRLRILPVSPQLLELEARALDDVGRYLVAAAKWRELIRAGGSSASEQALAVALLNGGEHAEAAAILERLLKQNDAYDVRLLLGRAYLALAQPERSIPHLRRAAALEPESTPANGALGEALLRTGDAPGAISALKRALADDHAGTRHFQLARAYRAAGEADQAAKALAEYRRRNALAEAERMDMEREEPISAP